MQRRIGNGAFGASGASSDSTNGHSKSLELDVAGFSAAISSIVYGRKDSMSK